MQLLKEDKSKIDNTIKYTFQSQNGPVEFSYINKNDGKDIICAPTQTSCNMGCTFCHLTGSGSKAVNLSSYEMFEGIVYAITSNRNNPNILVSFMGAGEPLLNINNVIDCCLQLKRNPENIRFAIATMMPSTSLMHEFTMQVRQHKIPMKVHLSLHSAIALTRQKLMPNALAPWTSMRALREYALTTDNPVELHYTLIDGVNDSDEELLALHDLMKIQHISNIKFLDFKPISPASEWVPRSQGSLPHSFSGSPKINTWLKTFEGSNLVAEFYNPPGSDIGASCGQFNV